MFDSIRRLIRHAWAFSWKGRGTARAMRRKSMDFDVLELRMTPDATTGGPAGANAFGIVPYPNDFPNELSGYGVVLGQLESGRPGVTDFDDPSFVHPNVTPTAVFYRTGAAVADENLIDPDGLYHATAVAGVIIAD